MKKLIAIVAVLALVLALAVPVLAAPPEKKSPEGKVVAANLKDDDIKALKDEVNHNETFKTAGVQLDNKGTTVTTNFGFVYNDKGEIARVYQLQDGKWVEVGFENTQSGIKVSFEDGGYFLYPPKGGSDKSAPAGGAAPAGAPAGGPGRSPQTGYNTALWTISAIAMALCAGYCFVAARKKVAE